MAKTAKKAKSAKPAQRSKAAVKAAKHHEDHVDGCLCGVDIPEHMFTRDEDLPPAKGGVASR